jgi:hypothetical protein
MPYLPKSAPYRRRGMGQSTGTDVPQNAAECAAAGGTWSNGTTPITFNGQQIQLPVGCQATSLTPGYMASSSGAYGQPGTGDAAAPVLTLAQANAMTTPAQAPGLTAQAKQASTPATVQSNAPNSSIAPAPVSSTPAQSNAPASVAVTPAASTTAAASCFALFGTEPCIGPIGLYTLLAAGGGALVLMMLLGGHK